MRGAVTTAAVVLLLTSTSSFQLGKTASPFLPSRATTSLSSLYRHSGGDAGASTSGRGSAAKAGARRRVVGWGLVENGEAFKDEDDDSLSEDITTEFFEVSAGGGGSTRVGTLAPPPTHSRR